MMHATLLQRAGKSLLTFFVLVTCLAACGDDDGDSKAKGTPTTAECGAGMPEANTTGCSDEQIAEYHECATKSCEATFDLCYGPDRENGNYSGVCGPYISCAMACGCGNSACVNACAGAQECGRCFVQNPCGTECLPNCNAQAGDKTCADLEVCCRTLPSLENRRDCMDVATQSRQLGELGDSLCNATFQGLCGYGEE